VDFGRPVELAGLQIRPGDLLHGDQNGLVRIPLEIAKNIPDIAIGLREQEEQPTEWHYPG
jgi:4-hydroxy-4-methyl-2-oxoglutarate aldolase